MESKLTVYRRRCLQLPPRRQQAWKVGTIVSCPKTADRMTENVLRKGNLPEAAVLLETDIKDRAEITSRKTVRTRHVVTGTLLYVKITDPNWDANSGKSVSSSTLRLTVSPAKSRRKVVEKDRLPY